MFQKIVGRLLIFSAIAIIVAPVCGSSATLARYTFADNYAPEDVPLEIIASNFGAGSAIEEVSLVNDSQQPPLSWSGANWTIANDMDEVESSNSYAWFQLAPQSGYFMTLTGMTIDVRPDGSGPDDFVVRVVNLTTGASSRFGEVFSHPDQTTIDGRKAWTTLFAASTEFQSLTDPHEIRIYGFDAKQAGRDVLFDNIQIDGFTFPIPEPAVFPLFTLASVFLVCRRRRHYAAFDHE